MPLAPETYTSEPELPHTRCSSVVVPVAILLHALPSQCSTVPRSPTTKTSFGAEPQTPRRYTLSAGPVHTPSGSAYTAVPSNRSLLQARPSYRRMRPEGPTAQTSLGPKP